MSGNPTYVLKVLADDGSLVRRFPLAPGEHTVGSASDAEIHLEAAGLSRRHGNSLLFDLCSNGAYQTCSL